MYFGYKHQRKVEKNYSNFNEKLKGVVKKEKKSKEIQTCPHEISQEEIKKSFTIIILNLCNFLNQILFYLLFYFNVIELNTVKRIYTQFNFTKARYLIKRFIKCYT